jgi:ParB family transcriptional regulator, chromosome partitioning protein
MEINKDSSNKKRLGRGIGSLLGGATMPEITSDNQVNQMQSTPKNEYSNKSQATTSTAHDVAPENRIWNISIDKLVPGIYQPRKNFNKENIEELANSIKENGILQPLTARKRAAGGYEIIAGERRWRAAQVAGLHEVPVIIKNISDTEALQLAIIENVQREDLDPIEEAEAYQRLMQEFNYSQQQVSEKVGKERSTVANALRLIALPNEIKDMVSKQFLSVGHAKVLMALASKNEQIKLAKNAIEKQLSVRTLESLIKNINTAHNQTALNSSGKAGANPLKADLSQRLASELSEQLQKTLGTKVQINYKAGKGDLTIHFYSDEQLNAIYEKINR